MTRPKLIRLTTVPVSMNIILRGQLAFVNQYFHVIGISAWHEKHFPEIKEREGIEMINVEMARGISFGKDLLALWRLYKVFRQEKPVIVHTQTPKAGLVGMLAARFANVPVRLHTVGGLPLLGTKGVKRKLLIFLEKLTYRCAHQVYPNSHGLKSILVEEGLAPSNKLRVLGNGGSNGVNIDFFDPEQLASTTTRNQLRSQLAIPEDSFVFLFVGRIAEEKGFVELFEAFDQLQRTHGEGKIKLLLIGTFEEAHGVLNQSLKNRILENNDVIKPGRFDDVRPFYFLSDVYVFPSYREGFPNTLLEAGAMGLPIIATDINGCNEIVVPEENGLLIPVKDSSALLQAMVELMTNNEKRKQLSSRARTSIAGRFRREIIWKALIDEYNKFTKTEL